MMTVMAGKNLDMQIAEKKTELQNLTQQCQTLEAESQSLEEQLASIPADAPQRKGMEEGLNEQKAAIGEMKKGMGELSGAIEGMTAGKPVFIKVWPRSLAVSLLVGFILSFIFQPMILKAVMKKNGIEI